jgi:hypothetical protein
MNLMMAGMVFAGLSAVYKVRLFTVSPTSVRARECRRRLPAQAIIRDKDTWMSGPGGFDLASIRAGG